MSEGSFSIIFKNAHVKPLLKKHNLPQDELSSHRPISNLNLVAMVLERIIHARISSHLESFPSNSSLHTGSFIPLKQPFLVSKMIFFLQSINNKFQRYFAICLPLVIRLIINSLVHDILFLRSLQHSIEFNCFLSLGSNKISFYTVAFH